MVKQAFPIETIDTDNITANKFINTNIKNPQLTKIYNSIFTTDGPLLVNTSQLSIIKLLNASALESNESNLQRIYGIGFTEKKLYDSWKKYLEQSKFIDHRVLGPQLHLFYFHPSSPGTPFLLPRGTMIFNRLISYLRDEYRFRGYEEVITPQLFFASLWKTSGHLDNYSDDMFFINKNVFFLTFIIG